MKKYVLVPLLLALACAKAHRELDADGLVDLDDVTSGLDDAAGVPESVSAFSGSRTFAGPASPSIEGRLKSTRTPSSVKTWKRSQLVPNTSKLSVGDKEELPLSAMRANVRIEGFRARVTLDLLFYNDRDRQLEGQFKLRLPNGATPIRLGFGESEGKPEEREDPEQWKAPKEARVVPKQKAAQAYGDTVRRKVDPALLEWSGAGVFTARVFPLMPKKMHRIVIGYEVNLLPVGDDLEYRLDLPEVITQLDVDIKLNGKQHTQKRNPVRRSFVVRIKKPGALLIHGSDSGETGDYFATHFRPDVPVVRGASARRAVFLLDTSLSSNPERFNVWLKLLEEILTRNRAEMQEFAVGFFNIETSWWRKDFASNTPQNAAAVLAAARKLALEGATDLGQALAAAARFSGDIFLLSDGSPTWGEDDLHALGAHRPVFSYRTGFSGTDSRVLGHLARESGGAVFSVVGEAEVAAAATAHTKRAWRIASVELAGGEDLLLAGRPHMLFPGQHLWLAGRGKPAGGTIKLTLEQGGKTRVVETAVAQNIESEFAPSVYGQIAVGQLEELGYATEDLSRAYATHFKVVGKTCSLLMLETKEDYERFHIKPAEDAFVIRERPAAREIETTLEKLGTTLSDPKARMLAWLERLESAPGMKYKTPTALRIALEKLGRDAFRVQPDALACKARAWDDIPGAVQEQLASRKLTYDSITKEALRRHKQWGAADALRALSSLVEHSPGDLTLARDVGFSAMAWGLGGQAYHLFRRVSEKRPFEPHTYLALATCLEALGKRDLALVYYEVALAGEWNARFGDFPQIARFQYLRMLQGYGDGELAEFARGRERTVRGGLDIDAADLVVTIAWNTDRTDVDLHVVDPNKEVCYYSHPKTKIGGRLTKDVTQGFGPELFVLKKGIRGKYRVKVHYFSSDANRASARTKVYATVYENWGRKSERVTNKTVTLEYGKKEHDIALIERP